MTFLSTTDYFFEVSRDNVDDVEGALIEAYNPTPTAGGTVRSDIWGGGTTSMVYPTAAETWEIASNDINDTATGTGAAGFIVTYQDINHVVQTVTGTLTGTTAVTLNADHYRPMSLSITSVGSSSTTNKNIGTIELRVSGDGDPRGFIQPGFGVSKDTHFTIPAGKTGHIRNTTTSFAKNDDGEIMGEVKEDGADKPWLTGAILCFYQSPFNIPTLISGGIPEKSDIRVVTTSANGLAVTLFIELALVDN